MDKTPTIIVVTILILLVTAYFWDNITRSKSYGQWWAFFGWRARQLLSQVWFVLSTFTAIVALAYAVFIILVIFRAFPTNLMEALNMVTTLTFIGAAIIPASLLFFLLFALSLSPTGRHLADKIFRYSEFTDFQKLKNEVKDERELNKKRYENLLAELQNIRKDLNNHQHNNH